MTVDISKIKPGDKVTLIPLEVKDVLRSIEQIQLIDSDGDSMFFNPDQIAVHHPAPRVFQVGDRVRTREFAGDWFVEHIADGHAWIKSHNDAAKPCGWLIKLDDLTLVEAGQ